MDLRETSTRLRLLIAMPEIYKQINKYNDNARMSTIEFMTENKPTGGSVIKYYVTSSLLAHREAKT